MISTNLKSGYRCRMAVAASSAAARSTKRFGFGTEIASTPLGRISNQVDSELFMADSLVRRVERAQTAIRRQRGTADTGRGRNPGGGARLAARAAPPGRA